MGPGRRPLSPRPHAATHTSPRLPRHPAPCLLPFWARLTLIPSCSPLPPISPQADVAKVSKAHNDLIRVYEAKLAQFGVPPEELGFRPLVTTTSLGPAGLVSGQ